MTNADSISFHGRETCKTERAAQIELGKLLAMAQAGRQPVISPGRCPVSGKSALSHLNRPITARVSPLSARDLDPGWWAGWWMLLRWTLDARLA